MMGPSTAEMVVAGRYRVIGEIGRGGMGAVMLVEHIHTGDQLALKVLHRMFGDSPEIVERFRREARAAAKIKSEHVVRIIDADMSPELGGVPFLVMELLEGEDSRRRMRRLGAFTPEQALGILWQVGRALDRAHAAGIVHRDIKPENIFLHSRDDGIEVVKLLDFGVAKIRDDMQDAEATQAGTLLGTPYFMAPEQVRNHPVGPQTDVWALGMLAYRFLAGASYWPSATTGELMSMILNDPMPPPSTQNPRLAAVPGFDAWFLRSCHRDPARRWATAGEQVEALAEALGLPLPASISMNATLAPATQSHSGVQPAPAPGFASAPSLPPPAGSLPGTSSFPGAGSVAGTSSYPSAASLPGREPGIEAEPPPRSLLSFWVGLLAVFAVAAVGFVSFRVWQARHEAPVVTQAPAVATPPAPTTTTATTAANQATTAKADTTASASASAEAPSATASATAAPTVTATATMDLTAPPPATARATATARPADKNEDPWAR